MTFTGGLENAVEDAAVMLFRRQLAQQLRVDSLRASATVGLGHPMSSMSAAELMAVLLDGHLRLDFSYPRDPRRDHLIFSKGRAWPLYYAMLRRPERSAMKSSWAFRSSDAGRWVTRCSVRCRRTWPPARWDRGYPSASAWPWPADLDRLPYRVWVLCGDSEMAEGSTWEAFCYGGREGLGNLTVVVDANRLDRAGEIMLGRDLRRARAFGWHAIAIDGHDVDAIDRAYREAATNTGRPTVIFARTHIAAASKRPGTGWAALSGHRTIPRAMIAELASERRLRVHVVRPGTVRRPHRFEVCGQGELPRWDVGAEIATREAYGEALAALGHRRGDVVALDGEVPGATCSEPFAQAHPDRYFEMSMAERQMIAAAAGMQARGWAPFASVLFSRDFSRDGDFGCLAAISRANLRLVGSYADVAIGEDGASRMAVDDFASLRAVPGSTILHPSDANQVPPLVAQMADRPGISYMRTLRSKTVVRTHPDEDIRIGGSRLVRGSDDDDITVVACGLTVGQAEQAAAELEHDGVQVRVIDCYSIKPIDAHALRSAARQTKAIVTVEDHWPEGGLGDAVLSALADQPHRPPILRLAARDIPDMPGSGQPADLLHTAGIDAAGIVRAVRTHVTPTPRDAATSVDVLDETAAANGVLVRLDPIQPESASSSTSGERGKRPPAYGRTQPHQRREQRRRGHFRVHEPANRH